MFSFRVDTQKLSWAERRNLTSKKIFLLWAWFLSIMIIIKLKRLHLEGDDSFLQSELLFHERTRIKKNK